MILDYKGINISYTDSGKGPAVILLHGFLEDATMWQDLSPILSKKNRVISIDLLGHGKTECLGYVHTMEDMANAVHAVLKQLRLRKYTFIGHSMGGYVAIAFAKRYPESIKGLCLLNSTYEADSPERQQLRTRANTMAQNNLENMVRLSFANLFSEASKIEHKKEYETALQIALNTSLQGYMAAQEGMKQRADASVFFANATFKTLIVLGEKDTVIPVEKTLKFTKKHKIDTALFSEGHMSHIENKSKFISETLRFIEKK